jgi:hypothetical protein
MEKPPNNLIVNDGNMKISIPILIVIARRSPGMQAGEDKQANP